MKTTIAVEQMQPQKAGLHSERGDRKLFSRVQILKRVSPFLLLTIFLVILFPYVVVTSRSILSARLIIVPFLIANVALADFAIWNYIGGKRRFPIWISETTISAIILYWLF